MNNSKHKHNILVLCNNYPPYSGVGGLRIGTFVKYWRMHGAACTIVAPHGKAKTKLCIPGLKHNDSVLFVEVPQKHHNCKFRPLAALASGIKRFLMPDYNTDPALYNATKEVVERLMLLNHFTHVFCTVSHSLYPAAIGISAATKNNIPVFVDLRDLIEQKPASSPRQLQMNWRCIARRRTILRKASHITVVTTEHKELLQRSGIRNKDVSVIMNGYDPEVFAFQQPRQTNKFELVYAGRVLSKADSDPTLLFSAIECLIIHGHIDPTHVQISFYGSEKELIDKTIPEIIKPLVRFHPHLPYKELPKHLGNASILLLLTNRKRKGVLTTKLFEYIAIGRPILCTPSDHDALERFFSVNAIGKVCDDLDSTSQFIFHYYKDWMRNHRTPAITKETSAREYSRKAQAERVLALFSDY